MNFSSDMHIDENLIGDSFLMKTWMIISLKWASIKTILKEKRLAIKSPKRFPPENRIGYAQKLS